jgi:hypothetical protein
MPAEALGHSPSTASCASADICRQLLQAASAGSFGRQLLQAASAGRGCGQACVQACGEMQARPQLLVPRLPHLCLSQLSLSLSLYIYIHTHTHIYIYIHNIIMYISSRTQDPSMLEKHHSLRAFELMADRDINIFQNVPSAVKRVIYIYI